MDTAIGIVVNIGILATIATVFVALIVAVYRNIAG